MGNFTLRAETFSCALLALLFGTRTAQAQDYPSLEELYGRYTFEGTCTYVDMETGAEAEAPVPAATGYKMAVLPGEEENEVKILGFFGYGNGIKAKYDAGKGTLECSQEAAYICANMNMMEGGGVMVSVDGGEGGSLGYVYSVSKQDGSIVMTSQSPMTATYMSMTENGGMGTLTYAAGYTLKKDGNTVPVSSAEGNYAFSGENVVNTSVDAAEEVFDLTLKAKGEGKVAVSGLFGFADEIEADYYEDGGIVVLPSSVVFENGLFMGAFEGSADFEMMDAVYPFEEAPYLYVEEGRLVTPCSFFVYGEFDTEFYTRKQFSFQGGTAVKESNGVSGHGVGKTGILGGDGSIRVEGTEDTDIRVFDPQGILEASAHGSAATFGGLKPGFYIVKAGGRTAKVVVR